MATAEIDPATRARLRAAARSAAGKARCRYSGFPVGAALLLKDGRIVTGFNIESPAFGSTLCAERCCLVAAATQSGFVPSQGAAFAIYGASPAVLSPCGACRQVMWDMLEPDCPVFLFNGTGPEAQTDVKGLFPRPFGEGNLSK